MAEDVRKKIDELREKVGSGFGINRCPKKTMDWFFRFAEEEFCNDRGFALKFLVDFYTGVLDAGNEHLEASIVDLNRRLSVVEDKVLKSVEEKPKRTRLDGSPIKDEE